MPQVNSSEPHVFTALKYNYINIVSGTTFEVALELFNTVEGYGTLFITKCLLQDILDYVLDMWNNCPQPYAAQLRKIKEVSSQLQLSHICSVFLI